MTPSSATTRPIFLKHIFAHYSYSFCPKFTKIATQPLFTQVINMPLSHGPPLAPPPGRPFFGHCSYTLCPKNTKIGTHSLSSQVINMHLSHGPPLAPPPGHPFSNTFLPTTPTDFAQKTQKLVHSLSTVMSSTWRCHMGPLLRRHQADLFLDTAPTHFALKTRKLVHSLSTVMSST